MHNLEKKKMNQKLLITLISIFILNICYGQNNDIRTLKENMIRKLTIYEGKRIASTEIINSKGIAIEVHTDNFLGPGLKRSFFYKYDDTLLVEQISTHSSFPGDTTKWIYQYDTLGNLKTIKDINKDFVIFEYFYDSLNQRIKKISYDSPNILSSAIVYKYSPTGKEIESVSYGDSKLQRICKTIYDSLDRIVEYSNYDNDKLNYKIIYEYNRHQQLKNKKYTSDSPGGIYYIYNKKGEVTKRLHYINNFSKENITGREIIKYHRNGLIKSYKENIFSGSFKERKFKYKYEK